MISQVSSGNAAPRNHPLHRLSRELGDSLEVGVVVQDGQSGALRAGGYEQIGQRHRPMLGALGQHRLDLQRPFHTTFVERGSWHASEGLRCSAVRTSAAGTEKNLEVDDPTGGDLSRQEQWVQHFADLLASLVASQRALVGEESRHRPFSAPGARHYLGIVELQRTRGGKQLDQLPPPLELHNLGEGGVDSVCQRFGAEDRLGRVDLCAVDLERGLAPGCDSHTLSIATGILSDSESRKNLLSISHGSDT